MNVLLIALAVLAGYGILYLVARRYEPVGSAIGSLCAFLANVFVRIEEYMEKSARYCRSACLASLRYPPGLTEGDYWQGIIVLCRLVLLILALCILPGESAQVLVLLPILFHTSLHVNLPGVVEYASSALMVAIPAIWGACVLETMG